MFYLVKLETHATLTLFRIWPICLEINKIHWNDLATLGSFVMCTVYVNKFTFHQLKFTLGLQRRGSTWGCTGCRWGEVSYLLVTFEGGHFLWEQGRGPQKGVRMHPRFHDPPRNVLRDFVTPPPPYNVAWLICDPPPAYYGFTLIRLIMYTLYCYKHNNYLLDKNDST